MTRETRGRILKIAAPFVLAVLAGGVLWLVHVDSDAALYLVWSVTLGVAASASNMAARAHRRITRFDRYVAVLENRARLLDNLTASLRELMTGYENHLSVQLERMDAQEQVQDDQIKQLETLWAILQDHAAGDSRFHEIYEKHLRR